MRPATAVPAAGLEGRLTLRNGCLWIGNYLALWPSGSTLDTRDGAVIIRDAAGQSVASLGALIRAGGAAATEPELAQFISRTVPEECRSGLYFRAYTITALAQ